MGPQILPLVLGRDESVRIGSLLRFRNLAHGVLSRQPILADEVQTFKALITIHKVLQEGHPIALREGQANVNWLESLTRGGSGGDGFKGVHDPVV